MERDLGHAALDAIAFLAGATLSAMLGLMQWRVDRGAGRTSGYLLLWALGFVWTFGNFLRCTLELAGVSPDSLATKLAETFAWSCTLLGPLTIGRLLQGGIGAQDRASRAFLALCAGVSLLNLALLARANQVHDWQLERSSYPTVSFYVALVVGAAALVLYFVRRRGDGGANRRAMPRWFAPAAFLFAAIHTAAILSSMVFPGMPERLMTAATLVGRHWTIPWSILIAVSLAQAHYADVVLKRSLWLLASVALATVLSLWIVERPAGLPLLWTTLAIAALMLAAPGMIRAIDRLIDRTLLRRPDYDRARAELEQVLRAISSPQSLVETALQAVRKTVNVDAQWNDSTRRFDIALSHEARTLMQPEVAFLDAAATQLAHRLDALRHESEQRALLLREERLKRLLTEAELKALRTQVDPHFLFNTLNTIADLIGTNPEQAERMTERLAECFRYALAKHSRHLSTLDEEMDFARHYLEIEQVRFGERLRVQFSRGDATGSETVPSLLLQPLLENAIRHGLSSVREGGCVSVSAHREGARLRLRVEDDGIGLRAGSRHGVGLTNVQERLRTLYAQAAEFVIGARSGGRGTAVTIVIPLDEALHAH